MITQKSMVIEEFVESGLKIGKARLKLPRNRKFNRSWFLWTWPMTVERIRINGLNVYFWVGMPIEYWQMPRARF
jgi:hypothetical protein